MVFPKDVIFSGANLSKKEILESHRNKAKHIEREPFLVCLFEEFGHMIGKSENDKANTAV